MPLTFGSLFAGIGGLDLALERAGMTCKWQVENNEFCQKVLTKHWPNVPKYGDIRECGDNLEPVNLICGGFPCQDVSVAGKRAGITGSRSGLWSEFDRIIRVLRPRFVLVENVPGLLGAHGGLGDVLGDLAALGYDAEWDCIPAAAVGAPHLRYRVWIVGTQQRRPLADTGGEGLAIRSRSEKRRGTIRGEGDAAAAGSWWAVEPDVGRVAHGIPARVDRLRALGNAVVPQVAEMIGRQLLRALEDAA